MNEEQFKIFTLGFWAGTNSGMKNHPQKMKDLEFWHKEFVEGKFFKEFQIYVPFSTFWRIIDETYRPKKKLSMNKNELIPYSKIDAQHVHSKPLPDIEYEKLSPRAKMLYDKFAKIKR
jgi:hypothetical protein